MRHNKAFSLTIFAIGLCGILFVAWWVGSEAGRHDGHTAAGLPAVKQAGQRPFLALDDLFAEGHSKIVSDKDPGNSGQAKSLETAQKEPRFHLDDALTGVLDSDPQLHKFYNLRKKIVRTSVEQQDYLAMISDPKLIAAARQDLLDAFSGGDVDQSNELKRLQRIQYMNSALAWEDNPERAKALEAVTEVVMANLPGGASKSAIGSLLGDKYDLFQILMLSDPAQAEALLAKARGTRSEKVLQLAWSTGSPHKNTETP